MKGRSRKKKTVRQRETKTQETKTQNLDLGREKELHLDWQALKSNCSDFINIPKERMGPSEEGVGSG